MTPKGDSPAPTEPAPEKPARSEAAAEAHGPSRRNLLGLAGVTAGALAVGGAGGFAVGNAVAQGSTRGTYDFFGAHQSGILTPQQDHMHFAAFDVTTESKDRLIALLQRWSAAAAALMSGRELGRGTTGGARVAPPEDSGEALDLPPSALTITFGFGPGLFGDSRAARFGLASKRPAQLIDLPHFPGDVLEERFAGGDLCIQACADDPQVAVHAVRNLARIAAGDAAMRWSQLGFGRTSSTTREQNTPRNFMGFKDGTRNLKAEDTALVERWLWSQASDGQAWMDGGTYLVARRVRILIENWDRTSLERQEASVGRQKASGAPLSGGTEFTAPDFDARDAMGSRLIAPESHMALSHPNNNGGVMMLRRGYNYTDGADALGRLDAGLFFLAFVRDPRTQFVPMQEQLAKRDPMTVDFLRTTGSAVFAMPPGVTPGTPLGEGQGFVGEALFL
jgi:deferrochelatase/peroxidase EfeB